MPKLAKKRLLWFIKILGSPLYTIGVAVTSMTRLIINENDKATYLFLRFFITIIVLSSDRKRVAKIIIINKLFKKNPPVWLVDIVNLNKF